MTEHATPPQENDILPQVGETVFHDGKMYHCTTVEWEPGEDEIIVTYRRKYNDGSEVFGWRGQNPVLSVVDETHTWRRHLLESSTQSTDSPNSRGGDDGTG